MIGAPDMLPFSFAKAMTEQGNTFGMVGMTIAIITTLALLQAQNALTWGLIVGGLVIGGGIGALAPWIAWNVPMP